MSNLLTYEQGSYAGEYNTWGMAKNAREAAENVEAQRTALESRAAGIDGLIKYLRKNRDRFLSSIWDGIMSYASNFAAACTDGTIERILRNDNGTFAYHEGGEVHTVTPGEGGQPGLRPIGKLDLLAEMLRAWDYTPARQLAAIIELLQDAAANGLAPEAVATFKQEMKPEEGVTVFEAVRHTRREWDL